MSVNIPGLRVSVAVIALLAPMYVRGQSDSAAWRFVSPNAKAVIGIDWQRIRQTPGGALLREKLNTGLAAAIPASALLDQVDRVIISSPGNISSPGSGAGEAPMLIAVEGHFDAAKVRQVFTRLGSKPQAYNSYQVYRPQGPNSKDMAYVLADAGTILFGDAPSVFAALDGSQFAAPAPEPGSIIARAAELNATYEIWALFTSPDMLANDKLLDLFGDADWLTEAQGFEAGVQLHAGFAADVMVRFASEATAKRMAAEMTRLSAAVSKDKGDPRIQGLARKLKFSSDGSAAKISLHLTPLELEKNVQAFAQAHPAPAAGKPVAPAVITAVPAQPGVIRIEGLDEGPREIPFPDHQN